MPLPGSRRATGIGANPPCPESGTAVAIYNSSKSACPFDAKLGVSGWGGARNRADRISYGLTEKQVVSLLRTIDQTTEIGRPLNRHWTVHWERAGLPDAEACAATGSLLTLVRDWLRKQGLPFCYVWVRESEMGDGCKGSHVHILMHIPATLRWDGWRIRRWIERVTGRSYRRGTSCTKVIGRSRKAAQAGSEAFLVNLHAVASYVAKGASMDAVRALELHRHAPGGRIIGKRWGRSQDLRPA